ncbi:MAG: NUDIX hydrolase [Candidatus Binatia bacterium]|nr:NUDIX hydrolase [Candidatus Binatia bacterium]
MAVMASVWRFCPFCGGELAAGPRSPHWHCSLCGLTHYRNPAVGVAVILMESNQVLLTCRSRGRYAGLWCVPCGYVEWDEDVRRAAQREVKEETGLEIVVLDVCDVRSNFHDRDRQTVGIWFWGKRIGGELKPGDDASDARFFPLDALPPLAFPTDSAVLADIRRGTLVAPTSGEH